MALNRKKLQQKRARKAAKNRKRTAQKQRPAGVWAGGGVAMHHALKAPIFECWEPEHLFEDLHGIGTVVVSRKTAQGQVLIAVFLLDVYCLGIKNAFLQLLNLDQYAAHLEHIGDQEPIQAIHPACARKLVEDARDWAKQLGFSPHKDYKQAKLIFGDIEKQTCPRSFTFGRGGKPYYVAGPNDSASFQRRVMNKLHRRLGSDGFDYMLPMGDPEADWD